MAFNYSPKIITDGLVLYLDAANTRSYPGSGTVWSDLSRGGNNGTLTNGPTFNSGNGGSIVFDGSNDYILLPNGILSGTGNFTVNQWIKSNSTNYGTTFGNFPSGNLQIIYGINYIGMYLDNSTAYVSSPNSIYTQNIIMITALRSGTTTYFYINGILQKTGSSSSTIGNTNSTFRIGTNTINSEAFPGNIYNTQIYNRALSAQEIQQNYNATKGRYGL